MATSNMKAIPAANGFITYCLDPKGSKERVQYVHSTFTVPRAELKLSSGKKYDGIDFRISFDPNDKKITEKEFKEFVENVTAKYLGNRNYIAIAHNDTDHQHIHIISSFLDANGKPLNFAGRRNANAEAIRRQSIVDEACKKYNLSTLPRETGKYNNREGIPNFQYKKERITKAEKAGKQPDKSLLRELINNAKDISELEKYIVRETPNSLTFDFQGKKFRLNSINKNLKNRTDLEKYIKAKNHKEGNMKKKEDLLRAERSFVSRLNSFAEDMIRHGIPEMQVQSRIEKILQHRTESEDVQERWNALKLQQQELKEERQNWYEEKQRIRQRQYEQQRQEREQEYQQRQQTQALQRALSSNNPISAFAAALVLIISEIKKRQQKQQQNVNINEREIMEDILKTRETLRNPEPIRQGR
jgi:hypothetical protein